MFAAYSAPLHQLSCARILRYQPAAPDGRYTLDLDGTAGPLPPMGTYCDMSTDGGGWTLVLNYLHKGGTTPDTQLRLLSFPLLGSNILGADDAGTNYWGEIADVLVDLLKPSEVRLYCRTSGHGRVVHFKTWDAGCVGKMRGNTWNQCYFASINFSPLTG